MERLLAARGMRPLTMTIGSNGAIKEAARAGLGISIQSLWALSFELDSGVLVPLDLAEPLPSRSWHAIRPSEGPQRPLVEPFLSFLTEPAALQAIEDSRRSPVK